MRSVRSFVRIFMCCAALSALSVPTRADEPGVSPVGRTPKSAAMVANANSAFLRANIESLRERVERNEQVRTRLREALDGERAAGDLSAEELQKLLRQHEAEGDRLRQSLKSYENRLRRLEGVERLMGDLSASSPPQAHVASNDQPLQRLDAAQRERSAEAAGSTSASSARHGHPTSVELLERLLERNAAARKQLEEHLKFAEDQQRRREEAERPAAARELPAATQPERTEGGTGAAIRELNRSVADLQKQLAELRREVQAVQRARPSTPAEKKRATAAPSKGEKEAKREKKAKGEKKAKPPKPEKSPEKRPEKKLEKRTQKRTEKG